MTSDKKNKEQEKDLGILFQSTYIQQAYCKISSVLKQISKFLHYRAILNKNRIGSREETEKRSSTSSGEII